MAIFPRIRVIQNILNSVPSRSFALETRLKYPKVPIREILFPQNIIFKTFPLRLKKFPSLDNETKEVRFRVSKGVLLNRINTKTYVVIQTLLSMVVLRF